MVAALERRGGQRARCWTGAVEVVSMKTTVRTLLPHLDAHPTWGSILRYKMQYQFPNML